MTTAVVNLVTGLQGASKTLYTLSTVKDIAEKEGRQVHYHGINDLKLPWTLLEKPEDWPKVPNGSIVVIDEAQQCYRSRPAGAAVPAHVSALETLRHKGITLWLITQHPMLLDNHVRRLCGRHLHLIRRFGGQSANVHEFNAVREGVDKPGGRKDSIQTVFKFPKANFSLYKSAEVHTVKRSIPKRAFVLLLLPVALGGIGWILYKNFYGNRGASETVTASARVGEMPSGGSAAGNVDGGHVKTAEEYIAGYQPRIPGLDYTAPVYDKLTEPKRVPVPAACVTGKNHCQCYTQQGTKLQVKADQCAQIVRDGFFMAFDPDGEKPATAAVAASPAPSPTPAPMATPEPAPVQPQVVVVNDLGRGGRARSAMELDAFGDDDTVTKRLVRR